MAINVCIVGVGAWGTNFFGALAHPDCKVTCCIDASEERRNLVKERKPELNVYASIQECLANEKFDAAVVAIQTAYHFEVTKILLENGKDVLVEKPLTLNSETSKLLIEIAERCGRILMTGHVFLFNAGVNKLKEIGDSQSLGKVSYVRCLRANLGPIRTDVDALWDLAPHDISILNHLFDAVPERVSCIKSYPLGTKRADVAQATLHYTNGATGYIFASWLDPIKKREVTIIGDQKMATFDDMNQEHPVTLFDRSVAVSSDSPFVDSFGSFRLSITTAEISKPVVRVSEPLKDQCYHFIDCIINRRKPLSSGNFGLDVVRVLEALDRSWNHQGLITNVV